MPCPAIGSVSGSIPPPMSWGQGGAVSDQDVTVAQPPYGPTRGSRRATGGSAGKSVYGWSWYQNAHE